MNSKEIKEALAKRYSDGAVIIECPVPGKNKHSTYRMDMVVIQHSCHVSHVVGFEIKSNRLDFNQDKKWDRYLPYCHQMYFVSPAGIIAANEIDDRAGLITLEEFKCPSIGIWYKFNTVKIAPSRKVDIPAEFYAKVLYTALQGICAWRTFT